MPNMDRRGFLKLSAALGASLAWSYAGARPKASKSGWKERRAAERASVLLELGERLDEQAEEIARLVAREMGKPFRLALDREVRGAADKFRYFAGAARAIEGEVTGASPASNDSRRVAAASVPQADTPAG